MKMLFALSMLIFSVAPAFAENPPVVQPSPDPWAEFRVEQLKKALQAEEGNRWYRHHRRFDPRLDNGICVEHCDGIVEIASNPPSHRFYGNGIVDMLAGAKCINIPASGCDVNWTAKRHIKRAVYHAPVCH